MLSCGGNFCWWGKGEAEAVKGLYSEREFLDIICSSQSDRTITVDGYSD